MEGLFDLYFDCLKVQLAHFPKIHVRTKKPGKKQLEALQTGKTLIDPKKLPVDVERFNRVFSDVGGVVGARITQHKTVSAERFEALLNHPDLALNEEGTSHFLKNLLAFNTPYFTRLADALPLSHELVLFVGFQAISPFLEKAALPLRDAFDYDLWKRGFCPVCGRKPAMAKIRNEDGLKILQCSLCKSWWTYPQAKCTVCANDDRETLGFIHREDEPARRAELCDKCKKYMKTIDCRALGVDVNLDVEDLATVYLDVAASERGYESAGRTIYAFNLEPSDAPVVDGSDGSVA